MTPHDVPATELNATHPDGAQSRPAALRAERDRLVERTLDGDLAAAGFPAAYARAADAHLRPLFERATGGRPRGYALMAVGGYGRGQLCPGSDLDLVLIHRGRRRFGEVAETIWYALWDEGLKVDHSVRTPSQALTVAREDLKVLLGLLDSRLVAGDERVAGSLAEESAELLRKDAARLWPLLIDSVAARHDKAGELAFLLEPDLKQSAGGLRDMAVLRALRRALPPETIYSEPIEPLAESEALITTVRAALQCRTASASDRLALQEQDQVAALLAYPDADALMAALAQAGRVVSAGLEESFQRGRASLHPRRGATEPVPVEAGIVEGDGEVGITADADVAADPALALRLARIAAERHLLIDRGSLDRLARQAHRPDEPWDEVVRTAFVGLLSTGEALVPAVEALDRRRLLELYLPEWRSVRNRPQRNAYHRFTVDRHLLEAVAACGPHLGSVDRPDLLVLGALLHDLGKGFPGDHSQVGREIAEIVARRIGLGEDDVAVLGRIVAYHLVLPEFATRRDLDDPSTARVVAQIVEDRRTLSLLAALADADGRATGSAAWGQWKSELVATLVERVAHVLEGHELPPPRPPLAPEGLASALGGRRLGLVAAGRQVTVVAPDRPGVLAAVTGVLALHGCNVLRASVGETEGDMAVESFAVDFAFGRVPDWRRVEADVARALTGELALEASLREQERTYANARRPASATAPQVSVRIDDTTSALATILEVRAEDRLGVLHRIAAVLAEAELDVAAALVDTLGHEVVDTFYVRDENGDKIPATAARCVEVCAILREVLTHG